MTYSMKSGCGEGVCDLAAAIHRRKRELQKGLEVD